MKVGFVVAEYNFEVTKVMEERALAHAELLGLALGGVKRVPGCLDMPLVVKKLLEECDGVVALGAVVEGDTQHDEIVAQHCARKLVDLSVEFGKPVGFGVIGPGATRVQAQQKAVDYAERAVEAVAKVGKAIE